MAPAARAPRRQLIKNLQTHANMTEKEAGVFEYCVLAADYFSRHNHCGGLMVPGERHFRANGQEHTFKDVPFPKILEAVENWIKENVGLEQRTEVFHKVMDGIPGRRATPKWDKHVPNPREKPETSFSASRAAPGDVKTNQQLIDDLARAAKLTPISATSIRGQITWWDGIAPNGGYCSVTLGTGKVTGGRLGRDHTLDDVPNHFVRDMVLDYISTQLEEKKRKAALKAVFSDLTAAEIAAYQVELEKAKLEREQKEEREREEAVEKKRLETEGRTAARKAKAAENIRRQEAALDAIDENVDLTPYEDPAFTPRSLEVDWVGARSVLQRGTVTNIFEFISDDDVGEDIDYDADQVRAMIKRLVRGGPAKDRWTIDQFRLALCGIDRAELIPFLEMKGESGGTGSRVFDLSWEFFKRRELLGCPLPTIAPPSAPAAEKKGASRPALAPVDANSGGPKKRQAAAGKETRASKRAKSG